MVTNIKENKLSLKNLIFTTNSGAMTLFNGSTVTNPFKLVTNAQSS